MRNSYDGDHGAPFRRQQTRDQRVTASLILTTRYGVAKCKTLYLSASVGLRMHQGCPLEVRVCVQVITHFIGLFRS